MVERQQIEIRNLKYRLADLIRKVHGSSSEQFDDAQLKLFEQAEFKKPAAAGSPKDGDEPAAKSRKLRKQSRLKNSITNPPATDGI